jgi:hypothetical protein
MIDISDACFGHGISDKRVLFVESLRLQGIGALTPDWSTL